jgi:glucokinase
MTILAGVDIGGTKCAVCLGKVTGSAVEVILKKRFNTPSSPSKAIATFQTLLEDMLVECGLRDDLKAIGISCGGPLDSRSGLILSPPNLPQWDRVNVTSPLREAFGVPTGLQNDANACALAEWQWGAGQGFSNVIFLTFGTGMGAGLILDGRLYSGTNDMAGEVGHLRLEPDGPVGYGKAGSFEGFCSGGGMAQLARSMAAERINRGTPPSFCPTLEDLPGVSAASVADAAAQGDTLALEIYTLVGRRLGRGLAMLIDMLNPQRIIIGSIYTRQEKLLKHSMLETLRQEALPQSLAVCQVVPAGLGETVGDLASLSVGLITLQQWQHTQGQT